MILTLLLTATLLAQTPTATDSAIRQAVKDQVAAIKTAVARKAYVGPISAKSEASITITNLSNQTRTAVVAGDATIKLIAGKEGTFADLKVGNFVIAMGDMDSQGTLAVKRLLVIAKPAPDKRLVISGRVTDTTTTSFTLENSKKETWTVKYSKVKDLKVGNLVAVVGTSPSANNLTAKLVVPLSSPQSSPTP